MRRRPRVPRLRRYAHDHTKHWSAVADSSDAFVFVTPEDNHSFPASLKNALDYLHHEWANRAVGFVSYGGVSAGTRSMTALKPVVGALRMFAVPEAVNIPFFTQHVVGDGAFVPGDVTDGAADAMRDELAATDAVLRQRRLSPAGVPAAA